MSAGGSGPGTDVWARRRRRALQLTATAAHAEELLTFYAGLLELQRGVSERTPADRWLGVVRDDPDRSPRLRVSSLPVEELLVHFERFLADVVEIGTEAIAAGGRGLLEAREADRGAVLRAVLEHGAPESPEAEFHARAFVEGVLTALAGAEPQESGAMPSRRCTLCGAPPVVAALRDDGDTLGARSLVCSLCATEWRFPRLTCPHCGEADAQKLSVHAADSVEHVRIDECTTCGHYIKTVDLRRTGSAEPAVEDVATVELDLWARDRGLVKIRTNTLGL